MTFAGKNNPGLITVLPWHCVDVTKVLLEASVTCFEGIGNLSRSLGSRKLSLSVFFEWPEKRVTVSHLVKCS